MGNSGESVGYSIAAVSKLTGIGCHTLRVWERRYGFPFPARSHSGHRRYPAEQVRLLLLVGEKLREGGSAGEILPGLRDEVADKAGFAPESPESMAIEKTAAARVLEHLLAGDLEAAEIAYAREAAARSPEAQVSEILEPALVEVGERWFCGDVAIYQERFASSFLRSKILMLLAAAQRANVSPARRAIVVAVQGDRHEGGVLMLSFLLELAGWRVQILGVDVPTEEVARAVRDWAPDAVCVSFVLSRNINKRFQELAGLRGVPVFVGGRSILNYQGLARRYGLRPIGGTGRECVVRLIAAMDTGAGIAPPSPRETPSP